MWTVLGGGAALVVAGWKLPSRVPKLRRRVWYSVVVLLEGAFAAAFLALAFGGFRWWYATMGAALSLGNGLAASYCTHCGHASPMPGVDGLTTCSVCGASLQSVWQLPTKQGEIPPRSTQ
jgi:hypothetical protein